ncbi:recombinase family protein, partial [Granulicella sp. L56]
MSKVGTAQSPSDCSIISVMETCFVVWKLDRLSQSLRDVLTLMERIQEAKAGLPRPHRGDRRNDAG